MITNEMIKRAYKYSEETENTEHYIDRYHACLGVICEEIYRDLEKVEDLFPEHLPRNIAAFSIVTTIAMQYDLDLSVANEMMKEARGRYWDSLNIVLEEV